MKPVPAAILALLGVPFLLVGAYLGLSLGGAFFRLREFTRRVPATILAHESINVGGRRPLHRPTVLYEYEVNGERRESRRHDLLQTFPVFSRALGRQGRLPYRIGQTVTAHVDAEGEAVLSLELQYAALLGPAAFIFLAIGGALTVGAPGAAWRTAGIERDRKNGIHPPRFEPSQFGLAVLSLVVLGLALLTGLVVHQAGAWSVPAGILVGGLSVTFAVLLRLFVREQARRRPFTASRFRISGDEWTLSRGRLTAPSLELALREETRSMGEDGPGRWTGVDLACAPLAASAVPEGWRGTFRKDASLPAPVDEALRRRFWLIRVREGTRAADFPV